MYDVICNIRAISSKASNPVEEAQGEGRKASSVARQRVGPQKKTMADPLDLGEQVTTHYSCIIHNGQVGQILAFETTSSSIILNRPRVSQD